MNSEELDLVDEIFGPASNTLDAQPPAPKPAVNLVTLASVSETSSPTVAPRHLPNFHNPLARSGSRRLPGLPSAGLLVAFGVGLVATLALVVGVALAVLSSYSNRVVPGVRVGSVEVSGLSRDQLVERLRTSYAYLGRGDITVKTPVGAATITYEEAGRAADVEFMADDALRIGHSGNPVVDAVAMIRTAFDGESIPVVVRVDAAALEARVGKLADETAVAPQNARPKAQDGDFAYSRAAQGNTIDEKAVYSAIVAALARPDAPASFQAGDVFVSVDPGISNATAAEAIAAAGRMDVPVTLAWGDAATQSPSPSQTPDPSRSLTIEASTVRSWISFGTRTDGSYGPIVDASLVRAYLSPLGSKMATKPAEPLVEFDSAGTPIGVKGGKDGSGLDVAATAEAVVSYLEGVGSGGRAAASIAIVTAPVAPSINPDLLSRMVILNGGKGAWTTTFYPDISNGNGANIRVPAAILNGQVVYPGQQFSFLRFVGPIDPAHGFTLGGVIEKGKSNHTGAMGGGICSASTTMFNAAARAGLQIDERHAHFYYISRYPVGLDATVFSNGGQTWDLKWTNDTPNPIVIRAYATHGSTSRITIQLWSLPLDRHVTFSAEYKANVVRAGDITVYTTKLKPGQKVRAEYPTNGFSTARTRTVTDSTGKVIHKETWKSKYTRVTGILQVGVPASPVSLPGSTAPVPIPGIPAPSTLAPTANPTPALRRRSAGRVAL